MKRQYFITLVIFAATISYAGGGLSSYQLKKFDIKLQDIVSNHPSLQKQSQSKYYDVVVYSRSTEEAIAIHVMPQSVLPEFFTAKVTADQLLQLSTLESVKYIESPRMYKPLLDKSLVEMKVDKLHTGTVNNTQYKGKGVIVGVIDSGIDWKHQDFRLDSDTTKSRILFLLDQTTGKEFSQLQINNEIDGTPANIVDEKDNIGHGTHVASTAAGDGSASSGLYKGVAPEADLIIVKAGDGGFSSTNIINGITYIRQKADSLKKPFVINMSLGGHDGAHDGTTAEEKTVDVELKNVGRGIVIAAGNEGSDAIYTGGTLAQGGTASFQLTVPVYTAASGALNDYFVFSMWYKSGDQITVNVTSPNGSVVTAATGVRQTIETASGDGAVDLSNASSGVNPVNSANECAIQIYDNNAAKPPRNGVWKITLTGKTITQDGLYDVWLAGSSIKADADGASPEITTGAIFSKLVGMPATSKDGITVGAYVSKWSWTAIDSKKYSYAGTDRTNNYATFSSMGPTRDGRQKPDVSAPGQAIAAALSTSFSADIALTLPGGKYLIEQGTSMATPHVTGLIALMLQAKPTLTSAQIKNILQSTSRKDALTGTVPNAQWGYGKVDAVAAMGAVLSVQKSDDAVPQKFSLEQNYPNPFNPSTVISYQLPVNSVVTLKVYDVLGKEVATLLNEHLVAGTYTVRFDASVLSSGVYYYTVRSGEFVSTKKMVLLR